MYINNIKCRNAICKWVAVNRDYRTSLFIYDIYRLNYGRYTYISFIYCFAYNTQWLGRLATSSQLSHFIFEFTYALSYWHVFFSSSICFRMCVCVFVYFLNIFAQIMQSMFATSFLHTLRTIIWILYIKGVPIRAPLQKQSIIPKACRMCLHYRWPGGIYCISILSTSIGRLY